MHAPSVRSVETPYGWVVVVASLLLMATGFGGSYLVVVGLKPIAAEFDWPRQIPSLAYSLVMVGAGIGGILMGLWADRRGMGGPALIGAVMVGTGAILSGYATGIWSLFLPHFLLLGILGNGTMFSPLMTNATKWFDRRRGIAVAIVAGGQSLAGAIWPPIFRYTMDEWGWRATMIGFGITAICIMVPLSLCLRRPAPESGPRPGAAGLVADDDEKVLGLRPNVVLAMLGVAIVGCCIAMAMPMVHVVAYCSDLGFATARGAEMLSLLLGCAFMSRLAFGWVADRIGGLRTILIGASLQAVFLSAFAWVDSLASLYVVSALFGLAFGGIVPSYALAVRELFHVSQAGWRIGVVYFFGTIGMGLGGYVGGLIFDLTGSYERAFLTGVAFNLLNLVLIGTLVWRHRDEDPRIVVAHA